ncbi:hypothetical protein DAAJ005_14080 [Deinococcus sp. AJ005]|nr:hypothetical protein DAAJ005_14080 [Deinococcus sp. AJ005]
MAAFLPIFTAPDFRFAHNDSPLRQTGEKSFEMVGYAYDPQVRAFLDVLGCYGWVYSDDIFGWPEWAQTDEARQLRDDPGTLAQATPIQLARLLTVFARQERFNDGAMLGFWESGVLLGTLRRAEQLATNTQGVSS